MRTDFDTVFLGAGPAGTGPLLSAIQRCEHPRLLSKGILWIDQGDGMVGGTIGHHDILSDTAASVLLECLQGQEAGPLQPMLNSAITDEIRSYGAGSLPLPVAGRFLEELGKAVHQLVQASKASAFIPRTRAEGVDKDGDVFVTHVASNGARRAITSRRVVFSMGGYQAREEMLDARLAGDLRLGDRFREKTLTSSEVVRSAGQRALTTRLRDSADPRVVILGGSHSALTAAWLALNRTGVAFRDGAVEVFCRRHPKIFYPDRAAAGADGYTAWNERDVCPVTGRIFRLSGLRLAARDLMRSVRRLGDAPLESRLRVTLFDPAQDENLLRAALERADVVVAAFGYRPRLVPLRVDGHTCQLLASCGTRSPLVDESCRILARDGEPVPNAFGIGLASGFVPGGHLGGEPSFDGQTNGLWLYQNGIGEIILGQLLGDAEPHHRRAGGSSILPAYPDSWRTTIARNFGPPTR